MFEVSYFRRSIGFRYIFSHWWSLFQGPIKLQLQFAKNTAVTLRCEPAMVCGQLSDWEHVLVNWENQLRRILNSNLKLFNISIHRNGAIYTFTKTQHWYLIYRPLALVSGCGHTISWENLITNVFIVNFVSP